MSAAFTLRLEPLGRTLPLSAGQTLLEAALAAGLKPRSSCRNGTCRECICRLVEGRVSYAIEWPGLSADEKRDGYILPCVAVAEGDLVIVAPAARRVA